MNAPLYSRVTVWLTNQILTSASLNGEFNNVLTNAVAEGTTGYSASTSQMQLNTSPGTVGGESLAGSVSDEIQRLRYMLKFLSGAAQWYDSTGRNFGAGALAILTADIGAKQVTAAKVADATLTTTQMSASAGILGSQLSASAGIVKTQLAALGQIVASSSGGSFDTSSTTPVTVTNQSVTIVTLGRPVLIKLQSDGAGQFSEILLSRSSGVAIGTLKILRDGAEIHRERLGGIDQTGADVYRYPVGMISFIDVGASAASHTYSLTANVAAGTNSETLSVRYATLLVHEL